MEYENLILSRLEQHLEAVRSLQKNIGLISRIAVQIIDIYESGKKVILFGNGGSAADAQHIAAELAGRFYLDRPSLPAIALTVNTSSLTAIGNDYSFNEIFSKQLEGLGCKGDIAIGISTSGNSENVVDALKLARQKGLLTIGFTGQSGGKMKEVVDLCLYVPSDDTPRIQEAHITVGHIICEIVEKELFGTDEG